MSSGLCHETAVGAPYSIEEDEKTIVVRNKFGLLFAAHRDTRVMPSPQCNPAWEATKAFYYDAVNLINVKAEEMQKGGAE